jgi:hypothetical protein
MGARRGGEKMGMLTCAVDGQIEVADLAILSEDLAKVVFRHVFCQPLHDDLETASDLSQVFS